MRGVSYLALLVVGMGCAKGSTPVKSAVSVSETVEVKPISDETVVGTWSGRLQTPGASLPVVFHISKAGDGLSTTMDSPAQGLADMPTGSTVLAGSALTVQVPAVQGRYEGEVSQGQIDGTWTQMGQSMPLVLTPGMAGTAPPKRPQTPTAPFPYTEQTVEIASADGVILAGTFAIPKGEGPFTAVVLLTGSGPQDRDETIGGHKPFWVLSDHLAREGVAVLRVDDRGVGKSTGSFAASAIPDFAADAAAAMGWLDARSETAAVGYIGHSEGGYTGPLAHRSHAADFVVLLAGPGVAGGEVLLEQGALILAGAGESEEAVERQRARTRAVIDLITSDKSGPALRKEVVEALTADGEIPASMAPNLARTYTQPWFRAFVAHDPTDDLRNLQVPTLALFGSLDLQVPPAQSRLPMEQALGEYGKVVVFDGMNHMFQRAKTGMIDEYSTIETTIDPSVLDLIGTWVSEQAAPAE